MKQLLSCKMTIICGEYQSKLQDQLQFLQIKNLCCINKKPATKKTLKCFMNIHKRSTNIVREHSLVIPVKLRKDISDSFSIS